MDCRSAPKVVHVDKLKPCLQPTTQDTAPLPEPLTDETRVDTGRQAYNSPPMALLPVTPYNHCQV